MKNNRKTQRKLTFILTVNERNRTPYAFKSQKVKK